MNKFALALSIILIALVVGCFPPTSATPIFNGGSTCISGNGKSRPSACAFPTPTPTGSNSPSYNGCAVFPSNDPTWNTNVQSVSADADSANMLSAVATALGSTNATIGANHNSVFWLINQANAGNSVYSLTDTSFNVEQGINDVPFSSTFTWQDKLVNASSDHHLMIVSNKNCHVVEAYSNTNEASTGVSWSPAPAPHATALVDTTNRVKAIEYSLTAPYPTPNVNNSTQFGGGSGPYTGVVFPGVLRWEDFQNNSPHALEFVVSDAMLKGGSSEFVYPAKVACTVANCSGATDLPPMGSRLVLLSTAPSIPACYNSNPSLSSCPQTSFVINCLIQFGGYLSDLTGPSPGQLLIRMGNDSAGNDNWSNTDLAHLTYNGTTGLQVNSSNFKFIPPPFSTTSIANCLGLLNPNGC